MVTDTAIPGTRATPLTLLAIVVTVLAWASAFVVIRAVGEHFSPGALTLGRLLVGSVVLGAVLLVTRGWVRPSARDWLLLIGCGIAWFAVYNIALNAAELELDAGTTAMLVNVGPILIAVLAGTLLHEGIPPWLIGGAVVSLVGVVLISVGSRGAGGGSGWGIALCLLAAASYAIGVILQKVVLRRLPALQVTWIACTIGALVCLPFLVQLVDETVAAPAASVWAVAYLGAVPTALAFTTWAYALSRMPAGRLGVTTYLVPPLTIGIAWLFLAEVPAPLQVVGGVICLAGVALSRMPTRRVRP
ncbi:MULTISPECIES: DMT family transporter [unclassified Leifsonia]|uniref:DMT family transporter n=1 Tax=unclassified Leifsonia TaxID=2663824 RepID=UPI0006F6DC8D|nr:MULTISPECIES: DMT family transporter [unclassified Leifsonia]KQX08442.1 multidrug transporter [Leifsonia sp. Root1293]KRA12726.1 multidrug transporter [Leifsonia sp. Root60]